ncbi:SPOR domain-containing protein [Microcoleus sp. N3A4]|uniref:SPOR domain-containing protein n=1 Tax=Microcoleus sp. N3A4 TaxID=3055379 RepID=UPI002FD2DBCA
MSKRSSVESPNHQSSSTPIKPALQAVLGCLDVSLETELTAYRRHRRRAEQWVSPSVRTGGKQTATTEQQLAQNRQPEAAEETQQPLSLPLSLAGRQGDAPLATTRGGTKLSSSGLAPNNYLESSEKLIESLDDQKAEPAVERSLAASLLTPLGLSSMLLFLLSCTALGYAVMHPSSLVKMAGLNRLLDRTSPSPSDSPASTAISDTGTKELPKAPNLVSKEFVELDLSTLSNVKPTASPIASPSPKASIPPNPAAPPGPGAAVPIPTEDGNPARGREQGLNNLSTALLPTPSPSAAQPVPTLPTLPPTPSPAQPAAASPATASPAQPAAASPLGRPARAADGFYYVVTDYTDQKSLQQARTAVPDAYVRNFSKGVKIQMGALNDAASAERLVKELQAKGVKPQYYQP